MATRLDITIGPVQGFVAQSRRTRDLWGSSYLLSYLSAHAIHGAAEAGGKIVQPTVDGDPLYRWVSGSTDGAPPQLGSVPNHFVVEVDGPAPEVANAAVEFFNAAWRRVCEAVWERFVSHAQDAGNGTEDIWNRQVGGFWEVTWTAGPAGEQQGLLARRKHWRSHRPPDEPGDKCTMMHDLQELSGYVRAEGGESRQSQDEFWKRVGRRMSPLDRRDNERLSAIALVKRLFPLVQNQALGWNVDTQRWPSTADIAARLWLRDVISAAPQEASDYADAVRRNASGVLARRLEMPASHVEPESGAFGKLDANYLHSGSVRDERVCPLDEDAAQDVRRELARALEAIYTVEDERGRRLGPPPRFYALLLADGDRLGRLLHELGRETVGAALSRFTNEVPGIVADHEGVTVYAGGDDVLAILPVENALQCAAQLADCYRASFPGPAGGTLSAAVVFAQVARPLSGVVAEGHRLLDDVAKEGNGRNSLAVGVVKASGPHCQWVTSWTRRLPDDDTTPALTMLNNLVRQVRSGDNEPGVGGALVYRVRDMLGRICGWDRWRPGDWGAVPSELDIRALLHAEVGRSLSMTPVDGTQANADDVAESMWNLLGPSRSGTDDQGIEMSEAGVDALLLARFLADPRSEEEGG